MKCNYTKWNISIAIKVLCNISIIKHEWLKHIKILIRTINGFSMNNKKYSIQHKIFWSGFCKVVIVDSWSRSSIALDIHRDLQQSQPNFSYPNFSIQLHMSDTLETYNVHLNNNITRTCNYRENSKIMFCTPTKSKQAGMNAIINHNLVIDKY